jgi:hypothetical protein
MPGQNTARFIFYRIPRPPLIAFVLNKTPKPVNFYTTFNRNSSIITILTFAGDTVSAAGQPAAQAKDNMAEKANMVQ